MSVQLFITLLLPVLEVFGWVLILKKFEASVDEAGTIGL